MSAAFYDLLKQEVRLLMALLFSFMAQSNVFYLTHAMHEKVLIDMNQLWDLKYWFIIQIQNLY